MSRLYKILVLILIPVIAFASTHSQLTNTASDHELHQPGYTLPAQTMTPVANQTPGDVWYNPTPGQYNFWNGSTWVSFSGNSLLTVTATPTNTPSPTVTPTPTLPPTDYVDTTPVATVVPLITFNSNKNAYSSIGYQFGTGNPLFLGLNTIFRENNGGMGGTNAYGELLNENGFYIGQYTRATATDGTLIFMGNASGQEIDFDPRTTGPAFFDSTYVQIRDGYLSMDAHQIQDATTIIAEKFAIQATPGVGPVSVGLSQDVTFSAGVTGHYKGGILLGIN